jgi:hypothetical protein
MEGLAGLLILILIVGITLALLSGNGGKPEDNREPYLRDKAGHVYAIQIGPGAAHEDYIHDGTPHQNPAVREEGRWWFVFHYTVEVSYYPITINGRILPDLDAIEARVNAARAKGVDVALVTLDAGLEREVIKRENGEQLGRDVAPGQLAYKLNGRKR